MGSFSYHVGQRIKKYRKSRGYTIEQFSAMINKSKATLSKYENGTITIDIEIGTVQGVFHKKVCRSARFFPHSAVLYPADPACRPDSR